MTDLIERLRALARHEHSDVSIAEEAAAALAAMGGQGEARESRMVVLRRKQDGTPSVWCDPEIADLVAALNAGGVPTIASCSGHGERPGNIALADGRELLVAKDYAEARAIESASVANPAPRQPEARVGGEVDATDRVKFNWNEHLREHNALEYQHDFRLFEVVCSYVTKHLDEAHTTPPAKVPEGARLWLWRHHDHFLAFTHQYPCFTPGGDPMTLGPPVGYAVFRVSHDRAAAQPGGSNNDQVSTGNKTTHERNIMNEEQRKSFENAARPLIQWLCENAHPHHTVIVTPTNAELLEGSCSTGQILDFVRG